MKRACLLVLLVGLSLQAYAQTATPQGAPESEPKRVTIYSSLKHPENRPLSSFSFKTGRFEGYGWDLNYGSLYVGEDHDWFQVGLGKEVRSAFRDLGAHEWDDSFSVPVVEPFPVLKPGEQRHVTVDASGADGEDGADGAPGAPGADGANGTGVESVMTTRPVPEPPPPPRPRRPKRDGVPKVDPVFAKAVVGHMYVMRVVDEDDDFYVLFRVESQVRGDNCTITWKRIPPPAESAGRK
ncbi:MAG: hypothetical protein LC795_17380 [Acidobacteria bacterium]|nr:hypothetical protein [Acidobacteriota bacterium]